jgi:hypothetical protein
MANRQRYHSVKESPSGFGATGANATELAQKPSPPQRSERSVQPRRTSSRTPASAGVRRRRPLWLPPTLSPLTDRQWLRHGSHVRQLYLGRILFRSDIRTDRDRRKHDAISLVGASIESPQDDKLRSRRPARLNKDDVTSSGQRRADDFRERARTRRIARLLSSERSYGQFYRAIPLPDGIDENNATRRSRTACSR